MYRLRMFPRLLQPLLVLMVLASLGRAEPTPMARARNHFEAGRALYNLGNYADAAREFSAGYELVHRPQFLINLGQCYRKMNDLDRARDMYQQFLKEAPAGDPARSQVTQVLREMEPKSEPPAHATPPTVEPPAAPVEVSSANLPTNQVTAQAPAKKSSIARYWWIIPVATAAAVGLGVGLYFGLRPVGQVDCNSASLGCVSPGLLGAGP